VEFEPLKDSVSSECELSAQDRELKRGLLSLAREKCW